MFHEATKPLADDRMIVDDKNATDPSLAATCSRLRRRRVHPCIA